MAGAVAEGVDYGEVLIRDGGICHLCLDPVTDGHGQRPESLQFNHVIALASGGSHVSANVRTSHAVCGLKKGAHQASEMVRVSPAEDGPASLPESSQLDGETITD